LDEIYYWKGNFRYRETYSTGIATVPNDLNLLEDVLYYDIENSGLSSDSSNTFYCDVTNITISIFWLCDGYTDCRHGEDENEENCLKKLSGESINIFDHISGIVDNGENLNKRCGQIGEIYNIPDRSSILITHPAYPQMYRPHTRCVYILSVSDENLINVYILHFLLPDTAACLGDSLTIYDGQNINAPILGTYCRLPNYIPTTITSTGSKMFIKFKSDSDFHGTYLFMVRSSPKVNDSYEPDCFTFGHGYTNTANISSHGDCETWPSTSLIQFPVTNFVKPDQSLHNYCRQMTNDIPMEDFLEPQLRVAKTTHQKHFFRYLNFKF